MGPNICSVLNVRQPPFTTLAGRQQVVQVSQDIVQPEGNGPNELPEGIRAAGQPHWGTFVLKTTVPRDAEGGVLSTLQSEPDLPETL